MTLGHNERHPVEMDDPALASALRDFRSSVHAWSDVVYHRPRTVPAMSRPAAWRRSVVWALGLVLTAGIAGGGAYEHHHQKELAQIRAQQDAERQKQLAAKQEKETEELMAKIDSAISRPVPSAMEPLADLMSDDTAQ